MISLCDGERVASHLDTQRASELIRFPATYAEFTTQDSARLNVENLSEALVTFTQRDIELLALAANLAPAAVLDVVGQLAVAS